MRWPVDHLAAQHPVRPPRTRCVLEPTTALVVVAVALLASVAQGLTGFGFALVIVPFLLLVVDVQETVVISTLLGIASTALLMIRSRRHVQWPLVLRLLAGSVAGMPAGLAVLLFVPEQALRLAVAAIVLAMVAAMAAGTRLRDSGPRGELAVGLVAGVLRTSTGMPGPPVVLYLQGAGYRPHEFRAALSVFFLLGSVLSLAAFAGTHLVTGSAVVVSALALPAVVVGNWTGDRLLGMLDPTLFGRIVLLLLAVTALTAVATSVVRLAG